MENGGFFDWSLCNAIWTCKLNITLLGVVFHRGKILFLKTYGWYFFLHWPDFCSRDSKIYIREPMDLLVSSSHSTHSVLLLVEALRNDSPWHRLRNTLISFEYIWLAYIFRISIESYLLTLVSVMLTQTSTWYADPELRFSDQCHEQCFFRRSIIFIPYICRSQTLIVRPMTRWALFLDAYKLRFKKCRFSVLCKEDCTQSPFVSWNLLMHQVGRSESCYSMRTDGSDSLAFFGRFCVGLRFPAKSSY